MYFSFVDDVMFSHNWPHGASERRAAATDQNFQRIRQGAPRCLTLSSYTAAANCAPGAKSGVCDCLIVIVNELNIIAELTPQTDD